MKWDSIIKTISGLYTSSTVVEYMNSFASMAETPDGGLNYSEIS